MRPDELLTRDCQRLDWSRALRWPLVILVLAGLVHAATEPSDINALLAVACVFLAVGDWLYSFYIESELGYLEGDE